MCTVYLPYPIVCKVSVRDGYFAQTRSNNMDSQTRSNNLDLHMFEISNTRVVFVKADRSISYAFMTAQHERSGLYIMFAIEIQPLDRASTLVTCYGAKAISLGEAEKEYVPPQTPKLVIYSTEGEEPPSQAALEKIEPVAVELVYECLNTLPIFVEVIPSVVEVIPSEAPHAGSLFRNLSVMSFVSELPELLEVEQFEIPPIDDSQREIHSLEPSRKKQKVREVREVPGRRMSASHGLKRLPKPEFFVLIAPTDTTRIEPPSIPPVKNGRDKHHRLVQSWLNQALRVNPTTKEVMGMDEFVRTATVNKALIIADVMVPPVIRVKEVGPLKYAFLFTIAPDGSVSPSEYSRLHLSGNEQYKKFQADLEYLIRVVMAIYARSIGERMKSENRLRLSKDDLKRASVFLNLVTTGACKFASQPCSQPAPTTTKGGFVEEAGKLVYQLRSRSMTDGPYSKERGMMPKSLGFWVFKTLAEVLFFEGNHRGFDGVKNLPGRMATALQRREGRLGTPYKKDRFFVETSFIKEFITATDTKYQKTVTCDWKLYGKFFWTFVLEVCAARGQDTILLYIK